MNSNNKFHVLSLTFATIIAITAAFLCFSFTVDSLLALTGSLSGLLIMAAIPLFILLVLIWLEKPFILYSAVIFVITLLLLLYFESMLRQNNIMPSRYILSLQEVNDLYADEHGIYVANPADYEGINSHGFRSRDFNNPSCADSMPKVLFLGDSFTWGAAAEPITNSFVDLVDRAGYCTFNTGMPSTDPAQYAAVARTYIPLLNPDIVILMFCMDNDIMDCERPVIPHHPVMYATNGVINGLLMDAYKPGTCPREPFESFEEAKRYLAEMYGLYEPSFLGNSAIGTLIARKFKKEKVPPPVELPGYPVTDKYLLEIQTICDSLNIPLWIGIIPSKQKHIITDTAYYLHQVEGLFEAYKPEYIFCPQNLLITDYEPDPNAHLVNSGHKKFADEIIHRLDQWFSTHPVKVQTDSPVSDNAKR